MMEGPRHQHLHQEWQEPLEELSQELITVVQKFTRVQRAGQTNGIAKGFLRFLRALIQLFRAGVA